MENYAVELEGVSKKYNLGTARDHLFSKFKKSKDSNSFFALHDVSFKIRQGERVGIIGANGAGKSTLLKILSRITLPTKGNIRLRGRVASLLEVGTGFHPELTGRENIYLNGAILGMRTSEVQKKFDEIVEFSGIQDFIDTPVKRYSSGMYVRLAFAVAAHLETDILIVDEVLAVGDAVFQKKCLGKMDELGKRGERTLLFVSHNLGAVETLCERAIFLKKGRVEEDSTPDRAIARYLSSVYRSNASVSFEENSKLEAQILSVRLLQGSGRGEESARLGIKHPFRVEIQYRINRAISGATISLGIFNQGNECILGTADHDMDRNKLLARSVGSYTTSVEIPGYLFNSGRFYLVAGISIPGRHIYDRQECIQFEFVDTGSFMTDGGGEERRNSLLLMPLKWD